MQRPDTFEFAHIDADEVVYQAGHSSQRTWYNIYVHGEESDGWVARFRYKKEAKAYIDTWFGGLYNPDTQGGSGVLEDEEEVDEEYKALGNAKAYVKSIINHTKAKDVILYFSPPKNFRHARAFQEYKANRPKKPVHYQAIKDYLMRNYQWYVVDGIEADDCLGIQGYKSYLNGCKDIIVTNDKDLDMVPGWRYVPHRREVKFITPEEGLLSFAEQIIKGDTTDTIPSFKKITGKTGTKKIKDWIKEGTTYWEVFCRAWYTYWENSDMPEEETTAVVWQLADLLWMLRFKKGGRFIDWLRDHEHIDEHSLRIFDVRAFEARAYRSRDYT